MHHQPRGNQARYVQGSALSPHVQNACKARFVHRFTGDHKPAWTSKSWRDGRTYPLQFASDADWLANTWFAVTCAGFLDERVASCHSVPTWPNNPELRPTRPPTGPRSPGFLVDVAA